VTAVQRGHSDGVPAARTGTPKLVVLLDVSGAVLARMLIRDCFDRDSRQAGPAKTEDVGGAGRDIDDSTTDERPPVTDHQHRRAVIGEIGHPDMGSEWQRTMRAGHAAASAVVRRLARPALGLRGTAKGDECNSQNDNILQYSHSMLGYR
jgi:hypothetical protein